ncbi:MAG: hypothetical protein GYB67_13855 [Chloroflexi bacterium]|nr:hypothetical protein [Chloroflexota bacterium]
MHTLLAWIVTLGLLPLAYPWSAWLLDRTPHADRVLKLTLTLALSVGALTLLMFWIGLIGISFDAALIVALYGVLMLPGVLLWRRRAARQHPATRTAQSTRLQGVALLILTVISAALLFNATYWPFYRDDAVAIYHEQARLLTDLRTLVPLTGADSLYRTYPTLVPLGYTFTYLLSGWPNEYLAGLLPALLSLGCLPAAYLLGRALPDARVGWLSAVLLALTPTFGRWASSGYVDLPMAFFYTLSALFALRLWRSRNSVDALLAGALLGLAAWTKNAALLGVPLLGVWLLAALIDRRIGWRELVLAGAACAGIAAPWYLRNLIGAGFVIPPTAWTDQAQPTLANLLVFVTRPENFGLPGIIITLAVPLTGIALIRERTPGMILALLWALPFFAAWWLFVSYDPRFLLLFLPILCVLGAVWLIRWWDWIAAHRSERDQARLITAAALLALILTAQVVWFSVEYKDDLLRDPLMSDADKRALVRGE